MIPSSFSAPGHRPGSGHSVVSRLVAVGIGLLSLVGAPALRAQKAPLLASVTPQDGATGVGATTPLVFIFDEDMDTNVFLLGSSTGLTGNFSIQASSGTAPQMTGAWGPGKRTLTLTPFLSVPLNVTFTWTLNPAGVLSFLELTSTDRVPLATVSGSYTTGIGGPVLGSTTPANNAILVSPETSVVFRFNQPMEKESNLGGNPPSVPGAVSWTGAGLDATKFTYSWSTDGRQLNCENAGDLPLSTLISWVLNPAAAPVKLKSATGTVLPSDTYSGNFKTAASVPCNQNPFPSTWGSYSIAKRSNFQQTSAADPVEYPGGGNIFTTAVVSPSLGPAAVAGSITFPNGAQTNLTNLGALQYFEVLETEAELDAAYPPGEYVLRFTQTGLPERVISMTLPPVPPPTPKILNFAAAQMVNATQSFTLEWGPFTGADADDFISMYISTIQGQVVFQAPDPCVPRELPVTATSIVIPAQTFETDKTYSGEILFGKLFYFSTNAVPDMVGSGGLFRGTHFSVVTGTGGTLAPAELAGARVLPNGAFEFDLTGTPGGTYSVQRVGDLSAANWPAIGTVTINAGGIATFTDSQPGNVFPLFYRASAN